MEKAVEVIKLVKKFGDIEALKGITFEVNKNDIFALVGPNGAGKTTTFRIISTLILPTDGIVKVFGNDVVKEADKVRKIISYLPEDAGIYKNITGYEFLELIAKLYFGNGEKMHEALELGINIADLGKRIHDKMKTYSKGMKRRIHVARVLMVKPMLAILDEPTAGLDYEYAFEIREIIKEYNKKFNITFLVSSHNLQEIESIATKLAIIKEGNIIKVGKLEELIEEFKVKNVEELYLALVRPDRARKINVLK